MIYPIDVNYLIALMAGCFGFGLWAIYLILTKVQVQLGIRRTLEPQKNYGTIKIKERGEKSFLYICSYNEPDYKLKRKDGEHRFIFPINKPIETLWGAPHTEYWFNNGSDTIPKDATLMVPKNPDAKPGDSDYGFYVNKSVIDQPKAANPRSITSYLVQLRGLDREVQDKDKGKQGTSILMWLLLGAILVGVIIAAVFAYQSNSAATYTAHGIDNLTAFIK